MNTKLESRPLRERKFAKTKLGLLHAALEALEHRGLEEVSTRELCAAVSISQASFFNYFPRKEDLLTYFIQVWSLEMAWHGQRLAATLGGLGAIEEIFALTARETARHPTVMAEIVAWQVRHVATPPPPLTVSEKLLAHPTLDGVETLPQDAGLQALFPPLLVQAVERGELPAGVDVRDVMAALATIFFGVPVLGRQANLNNLEGLYRRQLQLLWAGLRASGKPEQP